MSSTFEASVTGKTADSRASSGRWREQRRLSGAVTAGPEGPGQQEGLAPGLAHGRPDEAAAHSDQAAGTGGRRPRPERLWLRVNRRVASMSLSVAAGVSAIDFWAVG